MGIIFQWRSGYDENRYIGWMCSGAAIGYLINISGLIIAALMEKPIHRRIVYILIII